MVVWCAGCASGFARFVASLRVFVFLRDSLPTWRIVDESSLEKHLEDELSKREGARGRERERKGRFRRQCCETLAETRFKDETGKYREKRGGIRRAAIRRRETNVDDESPRAGTPRTSEHFLYNHPVRCHRLSLIARISFIFIQLARGSLPFFFLSSLSLCHL